MKNTTLNPVELEFMELIRSTDERGKELILDALICTVAFGDEFLLDWGAAIDGGDHSEAEVVLKKWTEKAREIQ